MLEYSDMAEIGSTSDAELEGAIVRAAAGYVARASEGKEQPDVTKLQAVAKTVVDGLDEPEKQRLLAQLRLQGLLAGKDMQREVEGSHSETGTRLQDMA